MNSPTSRSRGRIYGNCFTCQGETRAFPITTDWAWVDLGEWNEDGVASGACSKGHAVHAMIQTARHVLLFDMACLALLDGYYREAVGSFAASVERFHEFVVRVLSWERGVSRETFDDIWKAMGSQSERQRGAFVMMYGLRIGSAVSVPDNELRNAVIHKGRIISRAEAMKYGAQCYGHILDITDQLCKTAFRALMEEMGRQAVERRAKLNLANDAPVMPLGSSISPVAPQRMNQPKVPFDQALAYLERYPMWVHPADRMTVGDLARDGNVSIHELLTVARDGRLRAYLQRALEELREAEPATDNLRGDR